MTGALFWRFAIFFTSLALTLCGLTYLILKKRLALGKKGLWALRIAIILTFFLLIGGPITFRAYQPDPENLAAYSSQLAQYVAMGWLGVLFILFFTAEVIHSLFRIFDPQKRIFMTAGVSRGLAVAGTLSVGIGLKQAFDGPEVKPVELTIPNLPEAFRGLKIAQISDVHIGPLLHRDFLESVVEKIHQQEPDLVFITGDLVDGTVNQLRNHIEPLSRLKAKDGVYFCTGNHEYYSGANEWIAHLESFGIHVFKNSNVVLTRKHVDLSDHKILLAGVYDFQAERVIPEHRSDPEQAAKTDADVSAKLLLAHNPFTAPAAAAAGFDVQFSGHTHAGQFYPFAWITKLVLQHVEGYYRVGEKMQLYVNRGTGYWGPPNRLGKAAEITIFRLV